MTGVFYENSYLFKVVLVTEVSPKFIQVQSFFKHLR